MSKGVKISEFFFFKAGVLIPLRHNPVRLRKMLGKALLVKKVQRKKLKTKKNIGFGEGLMATGPKAAVRMKLRRDLRNVKGPKVSKKIKKDSVH